MQKLKVGDKVSYHEDGGICICELLKYERIEGEQESATVKILEVVGQPYIGEYVVGEQFDVWHRLGVGEFSGNWHLFLEEGK